MTSDEQARVDAIQWDAARGLQGLHGIDHHGIARMLGADVPFLLDLLARQSEALEEEQSTFAVVLQQNKRVLKQLATVTAERDEAVRLQNANATAAVNVAELLHAAERENATLRAQLQVATDVAECHRQDAETLDQIEDSGRTIREELATLKAQLVTAQEALANHAIQCPQCQEAALRSASSAQE